MLQPNRPNRATFPMRNIPLVSCGRILQIELVEIDQLGYCQPAKNFLNGKKQNQYPNV